MSVYLVKQLGCFMSVNVGSICNVIVLYYVHFFTFCDKFSRHEYEKNRYGSNESNNVVYDCCRTCYN